MAGVRVLYLNPFSQQVSGPDESLLTFLSALVPLGVEPHVALPRPGPSVARYEALGARVHFLPLTVLKRRMGFGALLTLPFRLLRGALSVARTIRREHIDLVHTNMEVVLDGSVATTLLHVPHVIHYRGNTQDSPKAVFDLLTRFWTATSQRVVCISRGTAAIFERRGKSQHVSVLYNPVDLGRFSKAARREDVRLQLGANSGDLLAGTIGRIHPRKDIATFLKAGAVVMRDVPHLKLVVVGGAEAPEEFQYESELRSLAETLGIDSRLTWAGSRSDIPEVLKALDVLVLCSRHEGFGRVIAEAMVAGTPVLASREGAPLELVEEGRDGFLATPADTREFAEKLARLARSPSTRAALGALGAERARRFDAGDYAKALLDEYRSLLRAARPTVADDVSGGR